MPNFKWNFLPVRRGEMLADPVQSQFFTTDNVGGVGRALVRESIQNVLDAKRPDLSVEPVEIYYQIISIETSEIEPLFESLVSHLQAQDNGIPEKIKKFRKKTTFLLIEDFGTTGLEGDPSEFSLSAKNSNNGFFYFWRNIGRSGKSNASRGRWGLGKTVFPATSQINTFFGITRRMSDPEIGYLMGQAIFKNHTIGETSYTPYGHFGRFGVKDEDKHFAMPIADQNMIDEFGDVFKLQRGNQTGLSLIIVMPDDDITLPRLTVAVAEQYFYPILSGKLIVHVGESKIDRETLVPILEQNTEKTEDEYTVNIQQFARTLEFTKWTMNLTKDEHIILDSPPNLSKAPRWSDYKKRISDEVLSSIQARFAQMQRIGFIIPMKVSLLGENPVLSQFRVYFERDAELSAAENYFIREGITITGIKTLNQRDLRCIVVTDEMPLTTMLGDAENPAHTEWQKDSQNFKDKYEHGSSSIDFVKYSPKYLALLLTQNDKEVDVDLLKDIFFLERESEDVPKSKTPKPKKRKQQQVTENPIIPPLPRPESPIATIQTASGVVVKPSKQSEVSVKRVRIRLAYDTRGSNPFANYSPYDFVLENSSIIDINYNGGGLVYLESNHVEFQVTDPTNFQVEIQGFDTNRDLIVKTWWES